MKTEIIDLKEIELYEATVKGLIWERIPSNLKGYVVGDITDIDDMIEEFKNEYGEYDMRYPDFIDQSWGDAYQNSEEPIKYVEKVMPGILALLNGSASAM